MATTVSSDLIWVIYFLSHLKKKKKKIKSPDLLWMQGKNKIKIPRAPLSETPISQENAHLLQGGESRAGDVPTAWRGGSREERERKTERFPPKAKTVQPSLLW